MAYALSMFREKAVARVVEIPIEFIAPNPNQPRKHFDPASLMELAQSIRQYGILQPLTVRRRGTGYELVAGERRLRAAQVAGLSVVPCVLQDMDDNDSAICALIENLQRKDLDFFEEAEGIAKLISVYGLTQEQAAAKLSKNQSTIANKLRLLRYSEYERCKMLEAGLTERHARALLRITDNAQRREILDYIIKNNLNVSQTELVVEQALTKSEQAKEPPARKSRKMLIPKDIRLFLNSINHAIKTMKQAGIDVVVKQSKTDSCIEYIIQIPIAQQKEI